MTTPYTITLSNGVTAFDIYPLETDGPNNRSVPRPALTAILSPHPISLTNYFTAGGDLTYRFVAGFVYDITDVNGLFLTPASGTYTVPTGGAYVVGGPNPFTEIPAVETIPRGYFEIIGVNLGAKTWTIRGNFAVEFGPGNFININQNGADGIYTINFATNVGPNTDVTVIETIPVTATTQGYLSHREFPIVSFVPGLGGSVTFGGDLTFRFPVGSTFTITTSPTPTTFTVQSAVYGVNTTVTVDPLENVPPITTERVNINFLQALPIGFISYTVPAPLGVNTPLTLPGRGVLNWGQKLEESIVHVLENFANTTAPVSPLDGQLWFDTTTNTLNVRYLSTWNPLGGGSVIEPLNQIVYGTGVGVTSSPEFTYNDATKNLTFNPTALSIGSQPVVSIKSADFNAVGLVTGGRVEILSGDVFSIGSNTGNILLQTANNNVGGVSGEIRLVTGDANSVGSTSGDVVIIAGDGTVSDADGGSIRIGAGNAVDNLGSAGEVQISAGQNSNIFGPHGKILLQTFGMDFQILPDGEMQINTNVGTTGQVLTSQGLGLPVIWQTPSGSVAEPANQIVYGTGTSITSNSLFTIDPTNGAYTFGPYSVATTPGFVQITGAQSTGTDLGGGIIIQSGAGGATSGDSGVVLINSGSVTSGTTGSVSLSTSPGVGGNSGTISLLTGISDTSVGNIDIICGVSDGFGSGGISIQAGDSSLSSSAAGGAITIRAGNVNNLVGDGGNVIIESGTSNVDGGDITISAKSGQINSGNIILEAEESAAGTGLDGRIVNRAYGGTRFRNFDTNSFGGNCEEIKFILTTTTTGNTLTEIFLDTTLSRRMVLEDNTTWKYRIDIAARRIDSPNESAAYIIEGCIDRQSGAITTAFVGTPLTTILAEDTPSWDVVVDADTSNGALRIRVQGATGSTIRWTAFVNITQAR